MTQPPTSYVHCFPSIERIDRGTPSPDLESQHRSPPRSPIHTTQSMPNYETQYLRSHQTFIHVLDDDSLLNIFYLYRPALLDGDEADDNRALWGGNWARERWWYKVAQVCQRWRSLVLGSVSHLGLSLVCTYETRVADMLAHSPPLPLIIDLAGKPYKIAPEDEEGIICALRQRDRVRRIRLHMPVPVLQKLLAAIGGEFPLLEYLFISPPAKHNTGLILPKTFLAPHLRHFILINFAFPIRSPLLTRTAGLVMLSLGFIPPSVYFNPGDLLARLSLMPQLEILRVNFHSPVPNRDVQRQLFHTPITTHVTLPNLHWFGFGGASAYLEALLPQMTTPLLDKIQVDFFHQLTFSVPCLLHFMSTMENLRLSHARLVFNENGFYLRAYPSEEARAYSFYLSVRCDHLDWQVASAARILNMLDASLSGVVNLILNFDDHTSSSEGHDETSRTHWREILRPFNNVKTIRVPNGLVKELSRSLRVDDGEMPLELLPELKSLEYFSNGDGRAAFTPFQDARRIAGHPVNLVPRGTRPARR